jgi:TP53 regulating kinase-like protein
MEKLMAKGAEANIFEGKWLGHDVVIKVRPARPYRHRALDRALRYRRTLREAELLVAAKVAGVPTPPLYYVDRKLMKIIVGKVEGLRLKELLQRRPKAALASFRTLGRYVALLHKNGIMHGDLTTSNVFVGKKGVLVLIDFGLSYRSQREEDMAVDVHLLKSVLESAHVESARRAFEEFMAGYEEALGPKAVEIRKRVSQIEARGRYAREG